MVNLSQACIFQTSSFKLVFSEVTDILVKKKAKSTSAKLLRHRQKSILPPTSLIDKGIPTCLWVVIVENVVAKDEGKNKH